MPRIPTPKLPRVSRKVAAQVRRDTFAQVNPAQSQAAQLARSLSELAPSLAKFAGQVDDPGARERQAQEGIAFAEAQDAAGKNVADLIRDGKLLAQHSPFFRAGVIRASGRIAAAKAGGDILVGEATALKGATELAAHDSYWNSARADWERKNLEGINDKFFRAGFDARLNASQRQSRLNFARQIGARLQRQSEDVKHQEVFELLENDLLQGVDSAVTAENFSSMLDEWIAVNPGPGQGAINHAVMARAIINVSKKQNDLGILDLLDLIETGPRGKKGRRGRLASIAGIAEAREKAEQSIATELETRASIARAGAKREKVEAVNEVFGGFQKLLEESDNPHRVDVSGFVDRLGLIGANVEIDTLYRLRDAFAARDFQDDPNTEARMWGAIYGSNRGDDDFVVQRDIRLALAAKAITPETHNLMSRAIEVRDESGKPVISGEFMALARSELNGLFRNELGNFQTTVIRERFNRAQEALIMQLGQFLDANPDATRDEKITAVGELVNDNFFRFGEASRSKETKNIPARATGPQPVDWNKDILTDFENIQILELERRKRETEGPKWEGFSDDMVHILRMAGFPDAEELVKAQYRVHAQVKLDARARRHLPKTLSEDK